MTRLGFFDRMSYNYIVMKLLLAESVKGCNFIELKEMPNENVKKALFERRRCICKGNLAEEYQCYCVDLTFKP